MTNFSDRNFYKELMIRMLRVNRFEEAAKALFGKGQVHGTLHLCVGEEASVIGSTAALKEQDYILTTHRGHGECIGKGADLKAMMAEILGRASGTNRGIGGSMHICDLSHGIIGSNGIVGAGTPTACGAALTIKLKKIPDRISVSYFGDGAANSGGVLESMNLAGAWKLPIIFICIDNYYAVSTKVTEAAGDPDLTKRALPSGLKSFEADGNDVLAVYNTVSDARKHVIECGEPCFVVLHTYRISGHSRSDHNSYRTEQEMAYWREKGPILRYGRWLVENGVFSEEEIAEMNAAVDSEMDDVVSWALKQPYPAAEGLEEMVYV